MKQWFALSAIGKDRPGIVADLAELIFDEGCNLEDSSMSLLGTEFAVLLVFTGQGDDIEARLSRACKHLEWERRLTIFLRPLEGEPERVTSGERRGFHVDVTGADKAGIVARVARALADGGATVRRMRTRVRPEPETGTPHYAMEIEIDTPADVSSSDLEDALEGVSESLNLDVQLKEIDPTD